MSMASAQEQPKIRLSNGLYMPQFGLGTWKSPVGAVREAVKTAVRFGYRHIDCAAIYGNEKEVGEALAELFAEGYERSSLWITSKLWNTMHRADDVPKALSNTLADLGIEYLDLYLIHWPVTDVESESLTPPIEETWKAMELEVKAGRCRSIGVSNFSAKKVAAMQSYWTIAPAVNQVELHPLLRQEALLEACAKLGVHCTAYSPLGSPDSSAMLQHEGHSVMEHPVVKSIAEELGTSVANVLLKWAINRGTSVIPKSVTPARIESNFKSLELTLGPDHMAQLNAIEPQARMVHGAFFCKPNGPYKTPKDLWDGDI